MMWGSSIGTSLPGVRGRAIACTSEDNAVEIQTFWVPDPRRVQTDEERLLLEQFRPTETKHPPLEISIPEPMVDSKGVADIWGSVVDATMEPKGMSSTKRRSWLTRGRGTPHKTTPRRPRMHPV